MTATAVVAKEGDDVKKRWIVFAIFFVLILCALPLFFLPDGKPVSPQDEASPPEPVLTRAQTEDALEAGALLTETIEVFPIPARYVISGVDGVKQYPDFPTGCESAAAVTALRYCGAKITLAEFVDRYLKKSDDFRMIGDDLYGPDPKEFFIGSPRRDDSFGCMAPVIREALRRAGGDAVEVTDLTGMGLSEICTRYIYEDIPVLVWVTMEMTPVEEGVEWFLPSGKHFVWPAGEHCMVLIGYDSDNYFLIDPETGAVRSWEKALVETRYKEMGKQALAVKGTAAPQ